MDTPKRDTETVICILGVCICELVSVKGRKKRVFLQSLKFEVFEIGHTCVQVRAVCARLLILYESMRILVKFSAARWREKRVVG